MDPRRAAIRRNAHFTRGAKFFRDDEGAVMFEFVIDGLNSLGPRPAHDGDRRSHAEAWAAFEASDVAPIEAETFEIPAVTEQSPGQPKRAYRRKALTEGQSDDTETDETEAVQTEAVQTEGA